MIIIGIKKAAHTDGLQQCRRPDKAEKRAGAVSGAGGASFYNSGDQAGSLPSPGVSTRRSLVPVMSTEYSCVAPSEVAVPRFWR